MFLPDFVRGPWPETFKASFSRTNQMAHKRGRQKECVKIFPTLPTLIKRNEDKKMLGTSQIFLKISTHYMFGYPGLDASLNTSLFGGDIAFSDRQNRLRLAKPCFAPLQVR